MPAWFFIVHMGIATCATYGAATFASLVGKGVDVFELMPDGAAFIATAEFGYGRAVVFFFTVENLCALAA